MADLADTAIILIVLLLPGAFAAWGYERYLELYSRRSKDWFLRLAAISGMCLVVTSGPLYWLIVNYGDDFKNRQTLPFWMIFLPLAYVVIPVLLGILAGSIVSVLTDHYEIHGTARTRFFARHRNAPTAFDYLFQEEQSGMIRCRLKVSDRWVGGIFARGGFHGSYAAGRESEREIYISRAVHFDQTTGQPRRNAQQNWEWVGGDRGGGILVKWQDIETLEFIPLQGHLP